ncbi:Ig-like domain-containing protein, partial [Macrococcus capreoli]
EPGSTITVTLPDGTTVTTFTKPDGTWTVTVPPLKAGDKVTAVSTDKAGNASQPSSETVPTTPVVDTTAPEVVVNPVNPGDTVVDGTSEPDSTIKVTTPDGTTVTTVTKPDGTWTVTVPPVKAGDVITVVAIDDAGNTSEPVKVVVTGDNTGNNPGGNTGGNTQGGTKGNTPSTDNNGTVKVVDNTKGSKGTKDVKGHNIGKTELPDTGEKDNSGLAAGALLLGGLTLLAGRKRKQEDVQTDEK